MGSEKDEAHRLRIADLPELATPAEVANVLRCSPRFIHEECRAGRFGTSLVAGRYLITPVDVREYLAERRVAPSHGAFSAPLAKGSTPEHDPLRRFREAVAEVKEMVRQRRGGLSGDQR